MNALKKLVALVGLMVTMIATAQTPIKIGNLTQVTVAPGTSFIMLIIPGVTNYIISIPNLMAQMGSFTNAWQDIFVWGTASLNQVVVTNYVQVDTVYSGDLQVTNGVTRLTNTVPAFVTGAFLGVGGHWTGNSNGFLVDIYSLDGSTTAMKVLSP